MRYVLPTSFCLIESTQTCKCVVTVNGKHKRHHLISDHQQWPLEKVDTTTEQAMTSRKLGAHQVARGRQKNNNSNSSRHPTRLWSFWFHYWRLTTITLFRTCLARWNVDDDAAAHIISWRAHKSARHQRLSHVLMYALRAPSLLSKRWLVSLHKLTAWAWKSLKPCLLSLLHVYGT